jgi:pentatricopeptide repeat protein
MEKIGYKPDIVTYGTIMNYLCKMGKTNEAIGLFRKMEEINLELDVVLYSTIIDSLCRAGNFDTTREPDTNSTRN